MALVADPNTNYSLALALVYLVESDRVISKSKLVEFRSKVLENDDVFRPEFFINVVLFGADTADVSLGTEARQLLDEWTGNWQFRLAVAMLHR